MFETMSGFLWFFLIGFVAIMLGITFKERLVALEERMKGRVLQARDFLRAMAALARHEWQMRRKGAAWRKGAAR